MTTEQGKPLMTTVKGELRSWRWLGEEKRYVKGNFVPNDKVQYTNTPKNEVTLRVEHFSDRVDYYLVRAGYGQGAYICYKNEEIT